MKLRSNGGYGFLVTSVLGNWLFGGWGLGNNEEFRDRPYAIASMYVKIIDVYC